MNFYDRDWNLLGNKHELCCELEHYTGIPELILQDCGQLNTASVAKKMSWASQRQTTRSEDMSYCLLGIFDVNMPLLYGEGQKAFYRLQEAIMRRTTDHSILVWTPSSVSTGQGTGLLAAHPADYSDSGRVMHYSVRVPDAYELNNVGIRMSMPVFSEHNKHYILLGCRYEDDFSGTIGLEVEPFGSPKTNSDGLLIMQRRSGTRLFAEAYSTVMIQRSQILLVSSDFEHRKDTAKRNHGLKVWLQRDIRCSSMLRVAETWPKDRWNSGSHVFSWSGPVVPSSGARKGFILILPDEFKAKHFWKLPFGNPTLLLSFVNRLSVSTESRQECLFKATVFDRWPSTAEIAISDQSVDQSWTNVDDSDEDVEHILLVAQVFEVEVKVTVTRQVLMSTPVYILRVARDAPV
ncbi:Vegetative incompatibility protein HET-E-1 [Pseudocercospora fuligena]|uniref:Vegetative incompatibility protein HET-E-1 n=1 Tax=Pseudocercospora fuligena TaxID=685502 RepID=A0A8H6R672_9PEZI|nr:Vegetative incompatibility protein HET-E-1 [Pseudocercospora fuligena]